MSKQDSHFFNTFSVVIGLLVAFTIFVFFLARHVGQGQAERTVVDPLAVSAVSERVAPPVRLAVAGQDNSALKIEPPAGAAGGAGASLPVPKDGKGVFEAACTACHGMGIAGAPKAGDHAAWGPRIAQGKDTLYKHALEGFTGKAGIMPAKGGRADLPDDLIKEAVDYMTSL